MLKTFFCSLLFIPSICFCQDNKDFTVTNVTKANFFDLGFSVERKIHKEETLYAQLFLSTSIYLGYSSSLGNMSSVDVYPAFTLQYRYYYNGEKRESKGKRTAMNSMNYITLIAEANIYEEKSFDQTRQRSSKILGAAWGFQRNYPKRFSLDLNFGLGYFREKKLVMNLPGEYSDLAYGRVTTLGHVSFGFWLNKK